MIKQKLPERKDLLIQEYEKEIQYFTKKCNLNNEEIKTIRKLSNKLSLSPQRIIETIGVNYPIDEFKIESYENRINYTKKEIEVLKNEIRNKKGMIPEQKTLGDKLIDFLESIKGLLTPEQELLENERRLQRYEKIYEILQEASQHPQLQQKIFDKTPYKPKEFMNY